MYDGRVTDTVYKQVDSYHVLHNYSPRGPQTKESRECHTNSVVEHVEWSSLVPLFSPPLCIPLI